jgi:hypothetical protein
MEFPSFFIFFFYSVMKRKILGKSNTTRKYRKGLLIEKKIKEQETLF